MSIGRSTTQRSASWMSGVAMMLAALVLAASASAVPFTFLQPGFTQEIYA